MISFFMELEFPPFSTRESCFTSLMALLSRACPLYNHTHVITFFIKKHQKVEKMIQREIELEFAQLRQMLPNLPKKVDSIDEYELLLGAIEYIRNLNDLLKTQQ